MFATITSSIRRLPGWAQVIAWPLYGLFRTVVFIGEALGHMIQHAAAGFFGSIVSGSVVVVLAKIAGTLLGIGLLAVGIGLESVGGVFISLSMIPIALCGLAYMVSSVFPKKKKKKKKK